MAMYDFGPKPSWIENPPEGFMVTTAKASPDRFDFGLRRAAMDAGRQFLKDRGLQSANVRNLRSAGKQWFDNETGTAYVLTDTSNARVSDAVKLPTKEATTKAAPTRPSAPIRERRASEDPLTDAISADGDDAIDMAGLEPRRRTRQAPAPTFESEQIQSPAPTLQSEQVAPPTLRSEQVAPSMEERKRRMIDAGVGGLLRETATGKSDDQLLEQLMMDQLEIGEKARDVPRDTSSPQDKVVSTDRAMRGAPTQGIISPRLRSNIADISRRQQEEADRRVRIDNFEEQGPQARGTDVLNIRTDRDAFGYGMPASVANSISQQQGAVSGPLAQRENERLVEEAESKIRAETFEPSGPTMEQMEQGGLILEGERRREANPLQIRGAIQRGRKSSIDPQIQQPSMDKVEEGEIAPVGEGVEVSLLERLGNTGIGRAIRDNPELAASGVQLLGGLISNAAQNRAQRRADRTTDQRVARANLISAITGGRARPTVERAQADTGGFMSLDTLGKALQGGGAAVKGELSRRVEEAERERKAGLDERAAGLDERAAELAENRLELTKTANKNTEDYRNKITQIKEDELELRRDIFDAENNKQPVGKQLSDTKILELSSRIQAVAKTDELTDFLKDANFTFLEKGRYSLDNVPQLLFDGDAAEAEARRQSLIQAIASSYGGTLSNQDIERIDKQLFTQKDEMKTSLDIAKVFRSTLVGSLERDLRLLEEGGFNVGYIQNNLYETDQGQSESDADRLGSMLSDNPLDRISRQ